MTESRAGMTRHKRDAVPRSIVKWAGGKGEQVERLAALLPSSIEWYMEPFLGSGALLLHLLETKRISPLLACGSDANAALINLWKAVQADPRAVELHVRELECLEVERGLPTAYYSVRDAFNVQATRKDVGRGDPDPALAAMMFYLNKRGYNGLFRTNRAGEFNVPWNQEVGHIDTSVLQRVSRLVHGVMFEVTDIFNLLESPTSVVWRNATVYMDPPYYPIKKSSFTGYLQAFTVEQQSQLARAFFTLRGNVSCAILSNADTPEVRELYADADLIDEVWARRAINRKGDGRGPVSELIIRL